MTNNADHGMYLSPEYRIWRHIKARCHNPNNRAYLDYGYRGITVCDDWQNFKGFYKDMGKKPEGATIERIDNNKGYSPENCRWATRKEQQQNRRNNRNITILGKTKCLMEWCENFGIRFGFVWYRLGHGYPGAFAFWFPKVKDNRNTISIEIIRAIKDRNILNCYQY